MQPTATIADLRAKLKGKDQSKKKPIRSVKPEISIKSIMRKGR